MNNGFQYIIDVKFGGNSALAKAVQITSQLDRNINKITVDVSKASSGMNALGNKGKNAFDSLSSAASGLITRLGVVAGTYKVLGDAAKQEGFNSAIEAASGSSIEAAKNVAFLRNTVDTLGAPLVASQEGFKSLLGSIQGTNISMEQARNLFLGMSSASTVLKISSESSELALRALSQMASKGVVSLEELQGQLGEHIPGAMDKAAKAMGTTQEGLRKMINQGLSAEVFLPRFAAELQKTFGASALQQTDSATSNFNRMNSALYDLSVNIGTNLLPTATALIKNFLIPSVNWIGQNINGIGLLATTVGAAYVAYKAWTIGLTVWSVASKVVALGTTLLTSGVWGLSAAISANPIGLLITGFAAVAAGAYYAWNRFEKLRGFLTGGFYGAIEATKSILYALALPLIQISKGLVAAFSGDWKGFVKSVGNDTQYLISSIDRVNKAAKKGYEKGVGTSSSLAKTPKATGIATNALTTAFEQSKQNNPIGNIGNIGSTAQSKAEGITGNGPGKNVTINIAKFFDQITIQTIKAGEGADQLADMVIKKLVQAVNTANQVQ